MTTMSVTAQRPLNWNVLTVDARSADRIEHQLSASSAAAAAGGQIVALTMPTLVPMNMSFRTHCALFLIPAGATSWGSPGRAHGETRGPCRAHAAGRAGAQQGGRRLPRSGTLGHLRHRDTYSAANEGCAFRSVADIATERGTAPFDTLLDIVLADDLRTVLWPNTDTEKRLPGSCGPKSGATRAPWWAAPTPARTSTACAARATRPSFSVTACAGASSFRWRRPCTC